MKYYSTNHNSAKVTLREAVLRGLAPDRGLYMPERLEVMDKSFFAGIDSMTFQEMSFAAAQALFGDDILADDLKRIVYDTLSFER